MSGRTGQTVRVVVVNTDEAVAADLRAVLLSVPGVKIVAEVDEPSLLPQVIEQFPVEILLVHLDPEPSRMMDLVGPVIEARKDHIAAIGMTDHRDAELVVRAMRAGMREFLWKPFPPEQLTEIIQRVSASAPGGGKKLGRVISTIGVCGGAGATTLATNLAVELAQIENWTSSATASPKPRVVVIDLDLRFGQVAMHLDAQPTYSVAELCETPEHIDAQMIERAVWKHASGVHVLARPVELAQAERISAAQAGGALAALQEYYDFLVVDLPLRFDPTARSILDMSDTYLLVMQLVVPAVRNTDRIIAEMARSGYAAERIRIVCNRCGRESGHLEPADVETTLRRKLDFMIPDDWKACSTAVNMGAPLLVQAPKSKVRLAIRQIAISLLETHGSSAASAETDAAAEDGQKKRRFAFLAGSKT